MTGRNIIYYQTIRDDYSKNLAGSPFTHVYLAALHVHDDFTLYLNDWPAEDPRYQSLWGQWVPQWIAAGKSVMLLIGGAGNGTWAAIKNDLDRTPPPQEPVIIQRLLGLVGKHGLTGIDLNVETYGGHMVPLVKEIIARLRKYPPGITITMSPMPAQLADVDKIQADTGAALAWANVQMYCDFLPARELARCYFDYVEQYKNLGPGQLVAAVDLEPQCCASRGDLCTYVGQISKLAGGYPDFGGTAMWEYDFVFSNDYARQWPGCAAQALEGRMCQYCSG